MKNSPILNFAVNQLNQLWLITPATARFLYAKLPQIEIKQQIEAPVKAQSDEKESFRQFVEADNGVGIIHIEGVLSKHPMPSRWLDGGSITYPEISQAVEEFALDDSIKEIVLKIESSGGGFLGLKTAADAIFEARQIKNVTAYCEDRCSSAAYWLASQATRVVANPTARMPSIGAFAVLVDTQKQDEMLGLEYFLISTGGVKGKGADGKVDETLVEDVQREVNEVQGFFNLDIVRGRADKVSIDEVENLANGREYFAQDVLDFRLIDEIQDDFNSFLDGLVESQNMGIQSRPITKAQADSIVASVRDVFAEIIPATAPTIREEFTLKPEIKAKLLSVGAPVDATDDELILWAADMISTQRDHLKANADQIEELKPQAAEGKAAKESAIKAAITEGQRAKGEDFDVERWESRLDAMSISEVKELEFAWKEVGDDLFSAGKKVKAQAEPSEDTKTTVAKNDNENLDDSLYRV